MDAFEGTGILRWEPAPGWEGGGAFVLWAGDKPVNALRFAGGDLRPFDDGKPVKVKGKALGGRLLGLATVEVDSIERLGG